MVFLVLEVKGTKPWDGNIIIRRWTHLYRPCLTLKSNTLKAEGLLRLGCLCIGLDVGKENARHIFLRCWERSRFSVPGKSGMLAKDP
jgi:hypothetical protein